MRIQEKSAVVRHLSFGLSLLAFATTLGAQSAPNIHQATLMETGQKTQEISTEELRRILADKSAAVSLPGGKNNAAKNGASVA